MEQQPIVEESFIETKVIDNKSDFPIGQWEGNGLRETITTTITEKHEVAASSSSSSDDDQEGVRSKVITHHHEEETFEATEQVNKQYILHTFQWIIHLKLRVVVFSTFLFRFFF